MALRRAYRRGPSRSRPLVHLRRPLPYHTIRPSLSLKGLSMPYHIPCHPKLDPDNIDHSRRGAAELIIKPCHTIPYHAPWPLEHAVLLAPLATFSSFQLVHLHSSTIPHHTIPRNPRHSQHTRQHTRGARPGGGGRGPFRGHACDAAACAGPGAPRHPKDCRSVTTFPAAGLITAVLVSGH